MPNELFPRPRLAVLIDAENIPAVAADEVFAAVTRVGEPVVRRIYGDFSDPRLTGWHRALARHALTAQQQFAVAAGKNAADIALVIDAMDLLHGNMVDAFCLVSSDSDFTRLATRIREHGREIYGFGGPSTPESFRAACRPFLHLSSLAPAGTPPLVPAPAPIVRSAPPPSAAPEPSVVVQMPVQPGSRPQLRQVSAQLLRRAFSQLPTNDGWAHLSPLGKVLRDISPGFDARQFGHKKLVDLVSDSGAFELDKRQGGVILVRPRKAQQ